MIFRFYDPTLVMKAMYKDGDEVKKGDIAFTDDEDVGTSHAWVWPFTAGVRIGL